MLCKKYLPSQLFILLQLFIFIWCQEPVFDIPVQLVGFPVIALSVRLADFAKKLMYSLNPGTYKSISKRSYNLNAQKEFTNTFEAKNIILKEFGKDSCIEEDVCTYSYKKSNGQSLSSKHFLRIYQGNIDTNTKSYLLSSLIGNAVKYPNLCSIFAKEMPCIKNLS